MATRGSLPEEGPAAADLVLMLIEFDGAGGSVGRSWSIQDPQLRAHLKHLTGHLGPPMTNVSGDQARQDLGLPRAAR